MPEHIISLGRTTQGHIRFRKKSGLISSMFTRIMVCLPKDGGPKNQRSAQAWPKHTKMRIQSRIRPGVLMIGNVAIGSVDEILTA